MSSGIISAVGVGVGVKVAAGVVGVGVRVGVGVGVRLGVGVGVFVGVGVGVVVGVGVGVGFGIKTKWIHLSESRKTLCVIGFPGAISKPKGTLAETRYNFPHGTLSIENQPSISLVAID